MMFTRLTGDWGRFMNTLPNVRVLDLHFGRRKEGSYDGCMAEVSEMVKDALKTAQRDGLNYVAFFHGSSTSLPFRTTARSIVRAIMRSKESTPYIIKARSYQHENVFIAAIRPKPTLSKERG